MGYSAQTAVPYYPQFQADAPSVAADPGRTPLFDPFTGERLPPRYRFDPFTGQCLGHGPPSVPAATWPPSQPIAYSEPAASVTTGPPQAIPLQLYNVAPGDLTMAPGSSSDA